jgi:hypothetical protein
LELSAYYSELLTISALSTIDYALLKVGLRSPLRVVVNDDLPMIPEGHIVGPIDVAKVVLVYPMNPAHLGHQH